jgi:4'-phosphopantetheinyl transferase EntD
MCELLRAEWLEALLQPERYVAFELEGQGDVGALAEHERPFIARATPRRAAEFAAGRSCAKAAMAVLGVTGVTLLVGSGREPVWPPAMIGSISHTNDFCIAVVGPEQRVHGRYGIGLDVEQIGRVGENLWRRLFVDEEATYLNSLHGRQRQLMSTVMFGAKEAFYKAQYQLTESWVGFSDVSITIDGNSMELRPASGLAVLDAFDWPVRGRWQERSGRAIAVVESSTCR